MFFTSQELADIEKFKNKTGKFNVEFTNILTKKLNNEQVFCDLVMISNYFLKTKRSYYWRGLYQCKLDSCNIQYRVYKEFQQSHTILLMANSTCSHKEQEKNVRTTGEKRKDMKNRMLSFGIINTQANNIIVNELYKNEEGEFLSGFSCFTNDSKLYFKILKYEL